MKERLTGAIILVALIVLLVPELLTGPIRSTPRAAAVAASAEGAPLRAYTINLADEARDRSATADASGPQPPAPLPAPAQPLTVASPATADPAAAPLPATSAPAATGAAQVAPRSAATSAVAAPSSPAAAGSGEGFMVQLGSFASRTNAEHLARQVRTQGFQASVSQEAGGRHLYRVRVGPARDRAAASALAQQLRSAGHSGSIVPR